MDKIKILKSATDETDEGILSAYLELAEGIILNHMYPYVDDLCVTKTNADGEEVPVYKMPRKYEVNQVQIAAYMLNKRGAEGELHHSENGTLRIYDSEDIPNDLLNDIPPHVGVLL